MSETDHIPLCYIKAWTRLPVNGAFREEIMPPDD